MTKRRAVTVTGSTDGALTNYQVEISITYDADMQSDFSDIRFRANDETTLLDFWLTDVVTSTSATAWVLMPSIAASPSTETIYMYYGNTGAAGGSNGFSTFKNFDDFNRASLNNPTTWTKYGSNPLTGYGYGDPCIFYEGGTYYLFVDNLSSGDIDLFYHTDPEAAIGSWTEVTSILGVGTGGSWDDTRVRDPHVIKVGSTYYMFYTGTDGAAATSHAIGFATSSSLTSGWSKASGNPIINPASGVNEPTVYHDGTTFHLLMTYDDGGGTASDIGIGDIYYAYATTTPPDSSADWSTPVSVLDYDGSGGWQDQEQIIDADSLLHMFVNDGNANILQSLSHDHADWGYASSGGGLIKGGTYDASGVYAPSFVKVGSIYRMYYQAQDGTGARIATATSSALDADSWYLFNSNFSISSNRLLKSGGTASWSRGHFMPPMPIPYVFEAELEFSSENSAGYIYGVYIAQDSDRSDRYAVIFDPSANGIALWQNTRPEAGTGSVLSSTTSYTVSLSTAHKIRVTVTATDISVDWHDGTSWNTGILTQGSLTLGAANGGFYSYDTGSNNAFYADNVVMREYTANPPSPSIGSEENVIEITARIPGVAFGGGMIIL